MNNEKSKTTLVMGASENTSRYSNMAIKLLNAYGHPVIALGKQKGAVDNIQILTDPKDIPAQDIDTVTLYLNPDNQKKYYNFILDLKPQRVIFNPGTENEELQDLLSKNQIHFEEACTLVLLRTSQF